MITLPNCTGIVTFGEINKLIDEASDLPKDALETIYYALPKR